MHIHASTKSEIYEFIYTTWINLENIMLKERSQSQNTTYCMSPCILKVQNRQIRRDKMKMGDWLGVRIGMKDFYGVMEMSIKLDCDDELYSLKG